MSLPLWKKFLIVSALVAFTASLLGSTLLAQKPAAEAKPTAAAEKKPRRALPAYFSAIVTEEQRTRIYGVQDKYEAQIAALAEQIKGLQDKRDTEIESVLSPEQKKLLDKARADAKAKASARKPTAEKPQDK